VPKCMVCDRGEGSERYLCVKCTERYPSVRSLAEYLLSRSRTTTSHAPYLRCDYCHSPVSHLVALAMEGGIVCPTHAQSDPKRCLCQVCRQEMSRASTKMVSGTYQGHPYSITGHPVCVANRLKEVEANVK
jgi:hypothetical protein